MNRNKVVLFLIIIAVLAGAGYFYLVQTTSPSGQNFCKKQIIKLARQKTVELDESIFKNLETDVITVVFSDDTTGPQAKEILTSNGLHDSTLYYILESDNYESWLTDARIHISDSIETARLVAEKAKSFEKVYNTEANELHWSTQSLHPEREKYFVDINFIDGVGQNEAKNEINTIGQLRLSAIASNPTIKEVASRIEIFEPRKDINITIENLTSNRAYSTCQQLLTNEKVVSCTPFPLVN